MKSTFTLPFSKFLQPFISTKKLKQLLCLMAFFSFGGLQVHASVQLSLAASVDSPSVNSGYIFVYTLNYSISSLTDNGINVVATLNLPDNLRPADTLQFSNSVAFDNSQVSSMTYNAGTITINFVNPIPAGSTGQLQIRMKYLNGSTPNGYAPNLVASIDAANNVNPDLSTGPLFSNILNVVARAVNRFAIVKTLTAGGAIDDQAIYRLNITAPGASVGALYLYNPVFVDTLPVGVEFVEATQFSGSDTPLYNSLNRTVTWTWASSPLAFNYSSSCYLIVRNTSPTFSLGSNVHNEATLFGDIPGLPIGTTIPTQKTGISDFNLSAPAAGAACAGGSIGAATAFWLNQHILAGTSCNSFQNGWYNSGNTVLDSVYLTYNVDEAINMNTIYVRPVYDGIGRVSDATIKVFYNTNLNPAFTQVGTYSSLAIGGSLTLPISLPGGEYIEQVRFEVRGVLPIGGSQNFSYCGDSRTHAQGKKDGSPITEGITYDPSNVGDDGTVVHNLSTGSYFYNGTQTNYSSCNGQAEIMYPQPVFGFTDKIITNSSTNFKASDTIDYKFQTYLGGNVTAQNVFVSDTLDPRLTYISGSSYFLVDNVPIAITPVISGNILTWNLVPPPLAVGKNYAIKFKAMVIPGTLAGTIPNRAVLGSSNALFNTVTSYVNATVITAVALRAFKGQSGCDAGFVYYPNFAIAQEGGHVNYKITVKNLGNIASKDFVLVDVFPFIGDARGSVWFANMVSPGTVSDPAATVYYTTTPNACYSDMVPPSFPAGCNTPIWTTTPPVDITTVKAIKITRTLPMAPLDSIVLTWNMRAPVGTPMGYLMNNSIIFQAKRNDNSAQLLPATPNLVGMYTNCTPVLGSLGNYTWIDVNKNGLQDESPAFGLNGIKIYLYGAGADNLIGGGDDVLLDSTLSANDFFGKPGYYKFVELASAKYYVKFTNEFNQYRLTPVTIQTNQIDFNNDATPVTGLSELITINASGSGQNKNNTTIDAGYFAIGTLGNYVWYDTNGNGLQDEPASNGINGVWVYLYRDNGSSYIKIDSVQTASNGSNPGYYQFTILDNGNYKVKFPFSGLMQLTSPTIAAGTDGNSDANQSTGFSPVIVMNVYNTGVAKNNPTIDAGYLCTNVVANFNISQIGCCGQVQIDNLSQFANAYQWKFENTEGFYTYACKDTNVTFQTILFPGIYTVTLIATNQYCNTVDTMVKSITLLAKPKSVFSYTLDSCSLNATFNSYSFNANTYKWNFGDAGSGLANVDLTANPTHTFSAAGAYQVSLIAGNGTGCFDTLTRSVIIQPGTGISPHAGFTYSPVISCTQKYAFTNTSTHTANVLWIFADGTTSTNFNVTKTFPRAGSFQVKLVAYSSTACSDVSTQTIVIASNANGPSTYFTIPDSIQCLKNNSFNFLNYSLYYGIGWNAHYYWDFGDGTHDYSNTFVYDKKYTNAGVYQVRLVAKGGWGCEDTTYKTVVVKASPTAAFTAGNSCSNNVIFTNTSTSTSPVIGSNWETGDGAKPCFDSSTFYHSYSRAGWYAPKLVVVAENGCYDSIQTFVNPVNDSVPRASFTYDTLHCANAINFDNHSSAGAYRWNFGDGSVTNLEQNPNHSYSVAGNYSVVLNVIKGLGCYASDTVIVHAPLGSGIAVPKGKMTAEVEACTNTITAYSQSVNAASTKWIFDGNIVGYGNYVVISHPSSGGHLLKLVVSNGTCFDTTYKAFQIMDSPRANYDFEVSACSNTAYFASKSKNTVQFSWDFGDPSSTLNTSTSPQTAHAFSVDGTYQVKLVAINNSACRDSIIQLITVSQGSNPNQARFGFDNAWCSACRCNNQVHFNNLTNGSHNTYLWSFGDGTNSVQISPVKGFPGAGNYEVTLTVNDSMGCLSSVTKEVLITAGAKGPSASFYTDQYLQCINNNNFIFYNNSTYMGSGWGVKYYWNLGDGTIDTLNGSVYNKKYASPGTYHVTLTMKGSDGCYDTMSTKVTVAALPCTGVVFLMGSNNGLYNGNFNPATYMSTSIAEQNANDNVNPLSLYPNPTTGEINLQFDKPVKGNYNISILDVLGREVASYQITTSGDKVLHLPDASLANGTYYVMVADELGKMDKKKLVVIR